MRRFVFFSLIFLCNSSSLCSQNLANPSFDSIYFGGINRVFDWITADGFAFYAGYSDDTIQVLQPNTYYDASGFQFSELLFSVSAEPPATGTGASIRLQTQPDKRKVSGAFYETFITNGNALRTDAEGYVDFSKGGSPFPYRPTALIGQYRFIDTVSAIDNFGKCIVLLKKYNVVSGITDTIAFTENTLAFNPVNDWTTFLLPIHYRSVEIPDSIVVVFFAGNNPSEVTELWLDDLSFDFTTSTINQLDKTSPPVIYPNPNSGWLKINARENEYVTYRILDAKGRLLRTASFQPQIPLFNLSGKFLILQLISDSGTSQTFKVVLQKN